MRISDWSSDVCSSDLCRQFSTAFGCSCRAERPRVLRHLPLQLPRRTRNSPTADVARRSAPRCAFHRDQLRAVPRACRRAPPPHTRPLRVSDRRRWFPPPPPPLSRRPPFPPRPPPIPPSAPPTPPPPCP